MRFMTGVKIHSCQIPLRSQTLLQSPTYLIPPKKRKRKKIPLYLLPLSLVTSLLSQSGKSNTDAMNSSPLNWEALDSLVIEFAKSENLFFDNEDSSTLSPPSSPSSSSLSPPPPSSSSSSSESYRSRLLIRRIRRLLESGDIDSALDLLRLHTPSILHDLRLLFCLQKQKFIELLRRGTPEDRDSAIECLRTSLAPCALDAYPEAYEEFKHILLALIYDKDDTNSPISSEWSERRRFEIAGLMSSILRAHLQAHDPLFSMTLRYLISLHKEFCLRQGVPSPISDLTERLLLEERDAPATLQELASGVPILQEEDIQALAHAVQLTRQGAVESLKFTKGDLVQALKNELCRMRLNESILDELVREYCVYRGIVAPGVPSSGSTLSVDTGHLKANQLNATGLSLDGSHDLDCGNSKSSDDGSSIVNAHVDGAEISTVMIRMQDTDVEMRFPCESTSNHDDCSTSSTHQTKNLKVCQRNKSHAVGDGRRRKRWRERNDDPYFPAGILSNESNKREGSEKYSPFDSTYKEDRCETVLSIKDLADRGMAAEVVEEVEALDPEFFGHNSLLLFQLKQVEFLKLVDSGDYSGALKVACSHLGPLAANNHDLLKPLKETLLALLRPNEVDFKRDLPLHALASSLQVAIGRRLGIEEPQLMKVMQAILHTHTEWFNLQMCKDRFESFLKIDALKEVNSLLLADTVSKSHLCAHTYGSSQVTVSSSSAIPEDSNSPTQVSSREVCDEGAILKVMEFLALPRADAIHLLAQCNGNAETAIQQIFGES